VPVLLYTRTNAPSGTRLKQFLETRLSGVEVETYETLEDLSRRFTQPLQDPSVAILLFTEGDELAETLALRHRFQDASLVLIVPNRDPETIARAHQLRPRFLTDLQNDLTAVTAVVEKMLKIKAGRPCP
jgi:hypothetical protein